MTKIELRTDYMTLGQLIKAVNLVSSGGEVKIFLAENQDKIYVNNVLENRRGKKLYKGDIIKIDNKEYQME